MPKKVTNIEVILESIMRGAAKILGCVSANLIIFNPKTHDVRIHVGAMAGSEPKVGEVEKVLGNTLNNTVVSMKTVEDSMVFAAWRDRAIHETSSLADLVGSAFPAIFVKAATIMIGQHRFICVPVLSGQTNLGVIIFTKGGSHPFAAQQREILVRYAQRIGEIIENDFRGRGTEIGPGSAEPWSRTAVLHLLLDVEGRVLGRSGSMDDVPSDLVGRIASQAALALKQADPKAEPIPFEVRTGPEEGEGGRHPALRAELSRLQVPGQDLVLCSLYAHRSRSESAVQTQLLHFALGDSAPSVLVDPQFMITSCNQATEQLFGYGSDELVGRPIGLLFKDAQDIETLLNHQFLFLTNGYFRDVAVVRDRSGRVFQCRVEALLLADEENRVIGMLVLLREAADAAVTGDQDNIHRLMRQERLATMGEMAAQLAHEIRNPLVSIGATLEMLRSDLPEPDETRETLAVLSNEIHRMDTTLKDYLSLAARRNASAGRVDVADVINDAIRSLGGRKQIESKSIVSTVEPGLTVLADHEGLRHVFLNLLQNALEATPDGGAVTCRSASTDRDITLHIDDQGLGLSCRPDECFEPFFTTKPNGTGLGLTVCQKIVSALGGAVSLRNIDGGGCRASVVLPRRMSP